MADNSLDDFFAKKDKSKKKGKSKVTPSDIFANFAPNPPTSEKREKKKKDKDSNTTTSPGGTVTKKEDEEWIDFEQETEADLTGLRIQNLQKKEEDENTEEYQEEYDEESGEQRERKDGSQGPWNKSSAQTHNRVPEAAPAPAPAPVVATSEVKAPTRYIPPGMRGMGAGAASSSSTSHRRKKGAPNLQSEEDFPTLGGASGEVDQQDRGHFEHVRAGNRQYDNQSSHEVKLTLGNKYAALRD